MESGRVGGKGGVTRELCGRGSESIGRIRIFGLCECSGKGEGLGDDAADAYRRREVVRRYGGTKVQVIPDTGEILTAELFVAVLGASRSPTGSDLEQTLSDWIGSHTRAFNYLAVSR